MSILLVSGKRISRPYEEVGNTIAVFKERLRTYEDHLNNITKDIQSKWLSLYSDLKNNVISKDTFNQQVKPLKEMLQNYDYTVNIKLNKEELLELIYDEE